MKLVNVMDSELPGAAPRLMASGTTGSSPVGSASVFATLVVRRDPFRARSSVG